jgi:hypothetical protein
VYGCMGVGVGGSDAIIVATHQAGLLSPISIGKEYVKCITIIDTIILHIHTHDAYYYDLPGGTAVSHHDWISWTSRRSVGCRGVGG